VSYPPLLLDHFERPRNAGELDPADAAATVRDPQRGDTLALSFRLEGDRIAAVRFRAYGCPVTIAAGSWATEALPGLTIREALELTDEAVARALGGLAEDQIERSVLVERVIRAAFAPPSSGP